MPIVKNQPNLITFFIRHPLWCLIKRICSKLSANGLEIAYLDITDLEAVRMMVREYNVNVVVNCVA